MIWDLAGLLLLSALSLTWFKGDYVINIGDFCFPLGRKIYFTVSTFLWDHSISMGYPAAGQLGAIFPYSLLGYITEILGFSLVSFEKIIFFMWFSLSGIGMYAVCSISGFSRPARIFAALLYMMNPYSLMIPWHLASGLLIAGYSMTPLLVFLLMRMLASGRLFDLVLMVIVWFVFGTYSYINPTVGVVHLIILCGYTIFYLACSARSGAAIRRPLLLAVGLFSGWTLASSYWLIPFLKSIAAMSAGASSAAMGFVSNQETFRINSAPLFESLRLHGLWSMFGFWRPWTPYYAWSPAYKSALIGTLSFISPALIILGLYFSEVRHRRHLVFFSSLLLAALFLMKGAYPPLEAVNYWLNENLPFFGTAFRAAYQKWGLIASFAFCFMAGYGAGVVIDRARRRGLKWGWAAGGILGILLFVVYMFPFWNGQVIFSGGGIIPQARAKIPQGYSQFYEWTKLQKGEFRIFSLPLSKNSNTIYKWDGSGYSGADFIRFFSDKPVIYANYGFFYDLPLLIAERIQARSTTGLAPLLSLLNARYLLVHDDINWPAIRELNWWINKDRRAVEEYLSKEKGLVLEKSFGPLRVYRLPEKYDSPHIYTAKTPIVYKGGVEGFVRASEKLGTEFPRLFIDEKDIKSGRLLSPVCKELPRLVFRQANSTRYEVSVNGATGPFWLVFGDTFNPGWKIFSARKHISFPGAGTSTRYQGFNVSEDLSSMAPSFGDASFMLRKPLEVAHFPGNTYANVWYIDPAAHGLGRDFSLEIFFTPQATVYAGLVIAVVLVVASLGYIILVSVGTSAKKQGAE